MHAHLDRQVPQFPQEFEPLLFVFLELSPLRSNCHALDGDLSEFTLFGGSNLSEVIESGACACACMKRQVATSHLHLGLCVDDLGLFFDGRDQVIRSHEAFDESQKLQTVLGI